MTKVVSAGDLHSRLTEPSIMLVIPVLPAATPVPLQPSGRIKWAAVAAGLEGRSDKQCSGRYRALTSGWVGACVSIWVGGGICLQTGTECWQWLLNCKLPLRLAQTAAEHFSPAVQ